MYPRRPRKKVNPRANLNLIKQQAAVFSRVHSEAGDPTVNDDVDLDYKIGDIWVNTGDDGIFVCTDNTDGAAVWKELQVV